MKISGFYRLVEVYPSPVVPLFRNGGDTAEYAQVVGEDGKITAFERAGKLDTERLLVEGTYDQTEIAVGSSALYALAYNANHVLINTADVVRREIRQYLYENRETLAPFVALDLARFVGDSSLIEETAERCRRKLVATAPKVTDLWIDGAPLSEDLKWKLRNRQIDLDGSAPPRPGTIRLGLIGPYRLMAGLTDYCAKVHHSYRAEMVRSLLSDAAAAKRITAATNSVEGVAETLAEYYRRHPGSSMFSRGRISVPLFDLASFSIASRNFQHTFRSTPSYSKLNSSPYFTRGVESTNFVMILSLFMHSYSDFNKFYRELVGA